MEVARSRFNAVIQPQQMASVKPLPILHLTDTDYRLKAELNR